LFLVCNSNKHPKCLLGLGRDLDTRNEELGGKSSAMHELIAAFSYICSQEKSKKNNKLWKEKNRNFEEIYLFN